MPNSHYIVVGIHREQLDLYAGLRLSTSELTSPPHSLAGYVSIIDSLLALHKDKISSLSSWLIELFLRSLVVSNTTA